MKEYINRVLSFYFNWAIAIDFALVFVLFTTVSHYNLANFFEVANKENWILSRLESLVSMNVSLAGFVLAALTIIVAIKSNLDSKSEIGGTKCRYPLIEESESDTNPTSESPMKLIFSSQHYTSIVRVYRKSISEFILSLIACHVVIAIHEYIEVKHFYILALALAFLTIAPLVRSIVVLFKILDLED